MKKWFHMLSVLCAVTVMMSAFSACGNSGNEQSPSSSKSVAGSEKPAAEGEAFELKLGHIMPADHPNGLGAEEFARLVSEKTNGNVRVSVFPASQLGNEKELFDAVEMGSLDFTILGFGEPAKKYRPILIFDAPYLAKDREQLVRILNSDVVAGVFDEMSQNINAMAIGPFYYGARYLTTGSKEVRNVSDMKGLKIRVPDQEIYVETLAAMGATPSPMAFSEVFLALQQGVIDGQENPLATIVSNKFNEVQKYLVKTEHIMGGNCIYVSSATMSKLPAEYQEAIKEAGFEAAQWINQEAFELEDQYLQQLQEDGMILIEDVDKEGFMSAANVLYDKFADIWGKDLALKLHSIE